MRDPVRDWLEQRQRRQPEAKSGELLRYPPDPPPPRWETAAKFLGTLIGGAIGTMALNGTLSEVLKRTEQKPEMVDRATYDQLATRVGAVEERASTCEWQFTNAKERAEKALGDAEAAQLKAEALEKWARGRGYRPPAKR